MTRQTTKKTCLGTIDQLRRNRVAMLIGLALAGSTAGGVAVGTGFECLRRGDDVGLDLGCAEGPKVTAAEYRAPWNTSKDKMRWVSSPDRSGATKSWKHA
jgi:hypothetical protein